MGPNIFDLSDLDGNNGFKIEETNRGDALGASVSSAGDFNGDGLADLIVGAPEVNASAGAAYIFFGSQNGFPARLTPEILDGSNGFAIEGLNGSGIIEFGDGLGFQATLAGDINGDHIDDLIVTADGANPNGRIDAGEAYIFFGSRERFNPTITPALLDGSNGFTLEGIEANDVFGFSAGEAGDINGDGIDDVVVGAIYASPEGNTRAGETYVVFGNTEGFPSRLNVSELDGKNGFTLAGVEEFTETGESVGSAGDINGDGIDDLVIATNEGPTGRDKRGEAYVLFGNTEGFPSRLNLSELDGSNGFVFRGTIASNIPVINISRAGDLNGDGIEDLVLGNPGASRSQLCRSNLFNPDGECYEGEAYVVFGRTESFPAIFELSSLDGNNGFVISRPIDSPSTPGEAVGFSVSGAGDIDNDGIDDLIVGARNKDNLTGGAYVIFGSQADFPATLDLRNLDSSDGIIINGVAPFEGTGFSVSGIGDLNGDGIDDLAIGGLETEDAEFFPIIDTSFPGVAYVIFGNANLSDRPDAAPDLVGTALEAVDRVLPGQPTSVSWTVANQGDAAAAGFEVAIVYSDDPIIGNDDDLTLETFSYDGLAAGESLSESFDLDLPLDVLLARALEEDPPNLGSGYASNHADWLGIQIDPEGNLENESDTDNNFNQGRGIDLDDITYFPWGTNQDDEVTPTNAIFVINRLGSIVSDPDFDPAADLDGNGEVTATDAIAVINRIGYTVNEGAIEALFLSLPENDGDSVSLSPDLLDNNQIVVKFTDSANLDEASDLRDGFGATVVRSVDPLNLQLWSLDRPTTEAAVAAYSNDPRIEYIEPNYTFTIDATLPNDPDFDALWGLHNIGQSGGTPDADIDAPEAWDVHIANEPVVVGVIDSGVDYTHPDLQDSMWINPGEIPDNGIDDDENGFIDDYYGYDFINDDGDPFDDNGHGTHVAGTIAAQFDNGIGVSGVSPDAQIMALKFIDEDGTGNLFDAIEAIEYATLMGADLTNNSWGGGGFSQSLENAIAAAGEAGQLFIAAAGNGGLGGFSGLGGNNDFIPSYPASYNLDNIISVAATDRSDRLASFSNYGATSVDLGAPGSDILSTVPGGGYAAFNGTSMATPHVAGVASLIWSQEPDLTPQAVKNRILSTVDPIPDLEGATLTGGRLNALGALVEPEPAEIRGRKWHDLNGDGIWDDGEPGLPDWTIYLDLNENGQLDPDEPSTMTAASGEYVFANLEPGRYTVAEVPQSGWEQTYPLAPLGYESSDSNEGGGPVFDWIDISEVGTELALADDDLAEVSLPFSFPFYGESKDTVKISSNGYLTFGSDGEDYTSDPIPDSNPPNDLIAPYWDDLAPHRQGAIYHYFDPEEEQFIVQYQDVPTLLFGFFPLSSFTFETVLKPDGSILFQYENIDRSFFDFFSNPTIGIENSSGLEGVQLSSDRRSIQDRLAIELVPQAGGRQSHTTVLSQGEVASGLDFGNYQLDSEISSPEGGEMTDNSFNPTDTSIGGDLTSMLDDLGQLPTELLEFANPGTSIFGDLTSVLDDLGQLSTELLEFANLDPLGGLFGI